MPKKYTVMINDDLDKKFRRAVFESKGMYKGNLTEAMEEAMNCWIEKTKVTKNKSLKKDITLKKPEVKKRAK